MIVGIEQWPEKDILEEEANSEILFADAGIGWWGLAILDYYFEEEEEKKKKQEEEEEEEKKGKEKQKKGKEEPK